MTAPLLKLSSASASVRKCKQERVRHYPFGPRPSAPRIPSLAFLALLSPLSTAVFQMGVGTDRDMVFYLNHGTHIQKRF